MSKVIKIVSRAKSTQPHKKSSRAEPSRAMRQPAQTCIVLMYSKFHCCFEQRSASLYFLEDSGILKCIKPNTTRQLSSLVEATISRLIHEPSQSGLSGVEFESSQLTRPMITLQGMSTQAYSSRLIHIRLHKNPQWRMIHNEKKIQSQNHFLLSKYQACCVYFFSMIDFIGILKIAYRETW